MRQPLFIRKANPHFIFIALIVFLSMLLTVSFIPLRSLIISLFPGHDQPVDAVLQYLPGGAVGSALKKASLPSGQLSFLISEGSPQVGRNAIQTIQVLVYNRQTYSPVSNAAATLLVIQPDGSEVRFLFPLTLENGSTFLEIRPLKEAPDGSLVSYEVCLIQADAGCKRESFIIWGD